MYKRTEENKKPKPYMEALDEWLYEQVIDPLYAAFDQFIADCNDGLTQDEATAKGEPAVEAVKKAIKEKILQSYHNGQAAKTSAQGERRPYGNR